MSQNIKYLHFGDRCQPYIIINLLLNIHTKTLFQLGVFPFNTIVEILDENKFDDIINPIYLKTVKYEYGTINTEYDKLEYLENDKINGYCHNNQPIVHKKYNGMVLMHDYALEENIIVNYNYIQNSHKIKKNNFYEFIDSDDLLCFISFLTDNNLKDLKYEKMYDLLKNKYNIKNFIIVIFTADKTFIPNNLPNCYEIIYLDNEFHDDFNRTKEYRKILYNEIWIKFTNRMKKYNIEYLSFEELFDINKIN